MEKYHRALELDKILNMLASETSCEDARKMAIDLKPAESLEEAQKLLQQTDDAYILVAKFGAPSFYGLTDITNAVRRAEAGGALNLTELLRIEASLRVIRAVCEWRNKSASIKTTLDYRFETLQPNKYLEDKINSVVKSEEEINDNASQTLANIRRKIVNAGQRVKDQLDKMVKSSTYQKYLQDAIVTQRDGRYVVPVKAEFRNEIKGLVHDTSASGATVFIEPMGVVEANNDIRLLRSQEKDEIERILYELSAEVGSFAGGICTSYHMLTELNLIFAKAHLAYKMKATLPKINDQGKIIVKRARHPLIDKNKVVPTDFELGTSFDTLVITGPNTGGKTVSIKTIGLFCLMAMCGLMLPCAENSEVSFFDRILVDIGDEQSIEQSLSTFSAHMVNIIKILELADSKSLVLIDELGAGTDPVEGAALAVAVIEALRIKHVRLAATTHYAELKEFALKTDGVENGSCEFDGNTLSPTYRLLIGVPGKSNAFAISKRLGMRPDIVARAKNLVSTESSEFEEVVSKLEHSRQKLEKENEALRKDRISVEKKLKEVEKLKEKAEKDSKKELEEARRQAGLIVSRTRAQAENLMEELEKLRKQRDKFMTAEQKQQLKAGIRNLEETSNPVEEKKPDDNYVLPRPLKVGDDVIIYDLGKEATVLEIPKEGDQILVQAGIIKTRIPLSNLRLFSNRQKKKQGVGKDKRTVKVVSASQDVSLDVDVRGMSSEEAIMEVDSFIDRCVRQGIATVTIIHGKGTGVLRNAIGQHLRKHPSIRSYRLGTYGEGESGVTIAELK